MTIKRSKLNELYCEFYGIPNDGLKIHYTDKIMYEKGQRSVLFLDEFNRAQQDVLNASLQLILDKKLNGFHLPRVMGKETLVVAAINPADDTEHNYTTNELDSALLDRFVSVDVEADIKAWLSYASDKNVDGTIVDFLSKNHKYLHFTSKDGGKGTTPRSWMHLAEYLKHKDSMPDNSFTYYLKGVLGDVVSSNFLVHYNNYSKAVDSKDIIELVAKKSKRSKKIETLTKAVADLIKDQEPITLSELTENMHKECIETENELAYLALLYAVPAEILSSYLQQLKQDSEEFKKLATLDGKVNNKELFKKLVKLQAQ